MFALISSRIAAWGQPPVSIARMRSAGKARFFIKNSWSSRVKMSFVTVADNVDKQKATAFLLFTDVILFPQPLAELEC